MYTNPRILIITFLAGLGVLLLPDKTTPVIRFNQMHGPSAMDIAGLVLMLLVWLSTAITVIKRRKKVVQLVGQSTVYLLAAVYLLAVCGIVFALSFSVEWLLWLAAGIAFIVNLTFIIPAFRKVIY